MVRRLAPWLSLLAFAATYAAAFEASDWISVYVLDWWDPKFGNRQGNLQFGREIMPLFVIVSTLSFAVGAAAFWGRLRKAATSRVLLTGIVAAILAEGLLFGFGLATRRSAGDQLVRFCGFALLFGSPALFGAASFLITSSGRTGRSDRDG
jgi:hypothetical protein